MNEKILITNIQRFSIHDGPGIRTTVFLKGCSLCCPWCSNPENITNDIQSYVKDGYNGVYGKWYNSEVLIEECLKDRAFYDSGSLTQPDWSIDNSEQIEQLPGGVTFSGGECLLQIERLLTVIRGLHEEQVHIAVETCLFVPRSFLQLAIEHVDLFYVDMKIINKELVKKVEHGNLDLYLENLSLLMNSSKPVIIRVPVIGKYTDMLSNREAVKELIKRYSKKILKVELIKEHNLAETKYRSLNQNMEYNGVSDETMNDYKQELSIIGVPVEICRI